MVDFVCTGLKTVASYAVFVEAPVAFDVCSGVGRNRRILCRHLAVGAEGRTQESDYARQSCVHVGMEFPPDE